MAKPHPFFLVLCLLPLAWRGLATPALPPLLAEAYHQSLQLKTEGSRRLLQRAEGAQQTDPALLLLLANYNDFLEVCVAQDQQRYEQLTEAQEQRLEALSRLPDRSPWTGYATAEAGVQLAMCKLLFGNRLSAAWQFRKAYLEYEENARRWPDFIPNRKNLGVLQVLIGSVPDQYQWFLGIIGMKGSVRQGIANLNAAAGESNPFQEEAQLLQAVVQHALEQDKATEAVRQVTAMAQAQPDNLLFRFVAMHLLKKTNQGESALRLYAQRPINASYMPFPYLHHMAADLYLFRGDYNTSVEENTLFLQLHHGRHYLKSAHYKLYIAYLLNHQPEQAKRHFNQIKASGIAETEEDKYALNYAEQQEHPVLPLLRARFHTDGGYYQAALEDLSQLQPTATTPLGVRAEYLYRKARIYHGLRNFPAAAGLYKQTIAVAAATNLYYAPNAALQLGYIYQQANQPAAAKAYFRQALRYKNYPYKNSIDSKAKLALSAL